MKCHMVRNKLQPWYNRLPIAQKMQLTTVMASTALLITFVLVLFFYIYNILLNQAILSARKDLHYTQNKLDAVCDRVETYALTLLSDETIQHYLSKAIQNGGEAADSLAVLTIQKRINTIVGTDKSISAVLIYDTQGRVYDSGVTMNSDVRSIYTYPPGVAVWTGTHKAPYRGVFDWTIDRQVISFIRSISDYRTGKLIGYVEICVDERTVAGLYAEQQLDNQVLVFMIDGDGRIVSHPDTSRLYAQYETRDVLTAQDRDFVHSNKQFVISRHYQRLDWYILETVSERTIMEPITNMINVIWITGLIVMLLSAVFVWLIARSITCNITKLASAMVTVKKSGWDNVRVDISSQDEIGTLAMTFCDMLAEIRETTSRLIGEQKAKREYQLELLQQQINPHFLYNTLDNVCALAQLGQNSRLIAMVGDITSFYRGVLNRGGIRISLQAEIEIARSYLNIMQIRFNDSFTYRIRIPDDLSKNVCLRLTLQPLLENSITHGFVTHLPGGVISISARAFSDFIVLAVCDNGIGIKREVTEKLSVAASNAEHQNGFGLITVHERIKLYFGNEYGMKVYSRFQTGTRILLKLPRTSWEDAGPSTAQQEKTI